MEKIDVDTARAIRRLKSFPSEPVTPAGEPAPSGSNHQLHRGHRQPPLSQSQSQSRWNTIRDITNGGGVGRGVTSTSKSTRTGPLALVGPLEQSPMEPSSSASAEDRAWTGSGGGGGGGSPATTVDDVPPSSSTQVLGASQLSSGLASQQVFLPHLNLENRFLVSAHNNASTHYGGYLLKRGAHMKVWRRRWFTVEHDCILYRKQPGDREVRGCIPLVMVRNIFRTDNVRSKAKYDNACICIKTDWRTYVVIAETSLEARQWNFYLFRVWRECVLRARCVSGYEVQNISSSDAIENPIDKDDDDSDEEVGGEGEGGTGLGGEAGYGGGERKKRSGLPKTSAKDDFIAQIKSIERMRSLVIRRLWKLAYKLVVLKKNVDFAKDVAEIYQKQADVVVQQRHGDTQMQRRAQESIKLLKRTLSKVNQLYEAEIKKRKACEKNAEDLASKVKNLEGDLAQALEQVKQKEQEEKQLKEDVMKYQKEVFQYHNNLKLQYHHSHSHSHQKQHSHQRISSEVKRTPPARSWQPQQ